MQFNIPGPSRVCLNARLSPRATACHPCAIPVPSPCPASQPEPSRLCLLPTHSSVPLHPPWQNGTGTGRVPQGAQAGRGCRATGMVLAQAVGRAHPCPSWVSGWRGVAAGSSDGECQADWHCQPCASPSRGKGAQGPPPPPYLPAGRDEVRLAGGTGLLLLHNNLVNGAWPAGEPGWRHHPLPAPPPPSGPAAPPAAARGAERSAGRAAGRVPRGRPAPSSILTPPERAAQHPQGPSSIPDSVPEHPGSVPASREHPPSISVSERRATPEHPRTSPAAERRSTPSIPRVPR